MKILLVTTTESLPFNITQALNRKNEYCAIVVNEVAPAKDFVKKIGLPVNLVYPLYELKNLIEEIYYDAVICVSDGLTGYDDLANYVQRCGCPQNKFIHLQNLNSASNFLLERALRYYEIHSSEFEIFATGNSHTAAGLDSTKFKYNLLNLGFSSQDLYYSFKIAKSIISGGGGDFKYALIGTAPYFFHSDISIAYSENFRLLHYAIPFRDLHNFWLSSENYLNLFNENFLDFKIPFENFDVNNVSFLKTPLRFMSTASRIDARERAEIWNSKYYSKTRDEYLKIFDDYLKLCEENNIRPIIILYPVSECYSKYFCKRILSEFYHFVGEATKKYSNAIFIDGWKLQGFDDSDFYDVDHMNIKGAAKFSMILNDVIEQLERK